MARGILITREKLEEWAGSLTEDELLQLAVAMADDPALPEAVKRLAKEILSEEKSEKKEEKDEEKEA